MTFLLVNSIYLIPDSTLQSSKLCKNLKTEFKIQSKGANLYYNVNHIYLKEFK